MISCRNHPDREAAGMCVACGKPFCEDCLVDVKGKYFCKPCIAERIRRLEQKRKAELEQHAEPDPIPEPQPDSLPTPKAPEKPFKKKSIAFALWFFLGGIGGHRYYSGHIYTAIGYTVLYFINSILTSPYYYAIISDPMDGLSEMFTGPAGFTSSLLLLFLFIDLILIVSNMFDDGEGRPLY